MNDDDLLRFTNHILAMTPKQLLALWKWVCLLYLARVMGKGDMAAMDREIRDAI